MWPMDANVSASEEMYRRIVEAVPEGIWVVDPQGRTIFSNRRMAEILGTDFELMPEQSCFGCVYPHELEDAQRHFARTLAGDRRPFDFRLRRADGSPIWVSISCMPIRDATGAPVGLLGLFSDITERKSAEEELARHRDHLEERVKERTRQLEAANAQLHEEIAERRRTEEALRENRAKLAAALASMTDAVFISDPEGRFIESNDAFATFYRFGKKEECPNTAAGYPCILDVFLPDGTLAPLEMWPVPRALRGETIANAEYTLRRKDTGETWVGSFSFAPIRGKNGVILGSVVVGRDITEQKRAEEYLRHTQKLESIGVLAGGIAHDFNNLLTAILGHASLLQVGADGSTRERLTAIVESGERAAALTHQLLAYAGMGRFEITDFDVSRLTRSSADLIRLSIPKNIDVHLDVPPDLPLVRGDSSQIQQVVMNLVINAAEAIGGREDGRVSIRAGIVDLDPVSADRVNSGIAVGRYISITVRDNGCGMDGSTKARIFDPFFTTKFTGRGLGLAAVQGILRSHKGAITVESSPGMGSAFTVYLRSTETQEGAPNGESTVTAIGQAATVLVVDDEEPARTFTKVALETLGYRVLITENGRQALDVLGSSADVGLVVLDVIMPVLGGSETVSEIRKRWPRLAILVVSGYSRFEAQRLGMPADLPFLEKPYTIKRLAGAVDRALQSCARPVE
jgi:PAS domain S-box-containing protein